MTRAVIYARVSTTRQASEGHSLDGQVSRLTEYAAKHELTIVGEPISEAESAGWANRPGVAKVRELAAAGEIDAVLATKSDRIARNVRDLLNLAHDLQNLGVDLILIDDHFDTTTPTGKAMFTVRAAFAELERDMIRQRIREGIAAAQAKGIRVGAPPTGYAPDPARRGALVIADDFQVAHRRKLEAAATRQRHGGKSLRQIAMSLEAAGVPTVTGSTRWSASMVQRLLTPGI